MANCVIAYNPCFSCAEKKCEICELDMHRKGVFQQNEGEWLEIDDGVLIGDGKHLECSECGIWKKGRQRSNFCPNCGAKMKGGAE